MGRFSMRRCSIVSETAPIETTKSDVSQTIGQRRIENLPINGRNDINFTLTNPQTTPDVSPTIGPAPNSGLNVGGARARGTMVSVDGADAVDNSINGIRSTLSQEGVQEFQLILSNFNAEYGRASGGVINIVTKSGTNDFHGNAFGYFRNKAFQARNPFSGAAELRGLAQSYAGFMGSATNVALNKVDFGLVAPALTGGLVNPGPGPQFPIPVACPVGATVGTVNCSTTPAAPGAGFSFGVASLPASYVALNNLRGNFPAMEKTSLWSGRLDHTWNNRNNSFLRVGVSPSLSTGNPSTAQNQVFGQNSGSRTGVTQSRDLSFTFQHDTIVSDKAVNEVRMQVARRA